MIEKKRTIDIGVVGIGVDKGIKDEPCIHPGHQPPTHLYIPPGETYEHECPACGDKRPMRGSPIRF